MASTMQARASATSSRNFAQRRGASLVPAISGVRASTPRRLALAPRASTVKDGDSGAEFQLAQQFWAGDVTRCLGAVTRSKKILIVSVQVYSASLYVEAEKCSKELGLRARGGFFESDADFCQALLDGAFNKILIVRLLRDVDGAMFADALNKSLVPRMTLAGEMDKLEQFSALFQAKKLTQGTEVVLCANLSGDLEVLVSPTALNSYGSSKPELTIKSAALSRNLFEIFLGSEPVVPAGIAAWAAGAKNLLDYEQVKRDTR